METTRRFGLIGRQLGYSYSADYFVQKFHVEHLDDCRYDLFPMELDEQNMASEMLRLVECHRLLGFNVTIPYKRLIVPLLCSLSDEAAAIGAVNCVRVDWTSEDKLRGFPFSLRGFNTDASAFADTLRPLLRPFDHEALILGTGGAAMAVDYALRKMGIAHLFVSRSPETFRDSHGGVAISYGQAREQVDGVSIIVNATPVGMYPRVDDTPWPDEGGLTARHLCYDLVYNPSETQFLRQGRLAGAITQNGLAMLHRQADLSWSIWNSNK